MHREPTKIEELAEHFMIHYATVLGTRSATWEYFDSEKYVALKMKSLITVNSSDTYTAACLEGLGITQAPLIGLKSKALY